MSRTSVLFMQVSMAAFVAVSGCKKSSPSEKFSQNPTASPAASKTKDGREIWDIYLMQGKRIGHSHTTVAPFHDEPTDRDLIRVERLDHLAVKREGQTTEEDIRTASTETPDGRLVRFECEIRMGPTPIVTKGTVKDGRLVIETATAGAKPSPPVSIPWPTDGLGPIASEQTLWNNPMKPGERRELTMLMIGEYQPCKIEMQAVKYESTPLLNGNFELLRIETITHLPNNQTIAGTLWTDRTGDTRKTSSEDLGLESYRVSKAEALHADDAPELDLLGSSMVKLEKPFDHASQTRQARYRIRLKNEDPAGFFAECSVQSVQSLDPHTAEITVFSIGPGRWEGNPDAPPDASTAGDRDPNDYIQSNDPLIAANAKEAAGNETDPWRIAVALEDYVHRTVKNKNYSQAFATASEVAKSLEGDCTEHAVYLAALLRARDIPARVAVGLVYMEPHQAFGYHMWTEAYIDGRWIPFDGAFGQGGVGADHLKIGNADLHGTSIYSTFLPVVRILGQLEIEVLDAQ